MSYREPHRNPHAAADAEQFVKNVARIQEERRETERNETPTEQMTEERLDATAKELRRAMHCLYIAVPQEVAADVNRIVQAHIDAYRDQVAILTDQLREARERADAFDAACVKALDARDAALAENARLREENKLLRSGRGKRWQIPATSEEEK
jgi:hypothetical protein